MGAYSSAGDGKDWAPSVKYLLVLVVAEIFVFGLFRTITNHGG